MRAAIVILCSAAVLASAETTVDMPETEEMADTLSLVDSILEQAVSYLDAPYVEEGISGSGFDCSGLSYRVFLDHGIVLPRTVTALESMGLPVEREDLQPGDLMIFHNPSHVGISIGDGEFIHCSSYLDRGVVITSIDHSNYLRRYYCSRRVL